MKYKYLVMNYSFVRGLTAGCALTAAISWKYIDVTLDKTGVEKPYPSTNLEQIASFGTPGQTGVLRHLSNIILYYDHSKKIPLWVQEHLTKDNLEGPADRSQAKFRSDPNLSELWKSHRSDYHSSGYSRGHMAAAANHKTNDQDMEDTFLLSNILPQDFDNNANYWARMELHTRHLTDKFSHVWVTSGPAFVPRKTEEAKQVVTYKVIGSNEVAVPTHLYKVICTADADGKKSLGAFLVPNSKVDEETTLQSVEMPIEKLEKLVGFSFYDKLDRSSTSNLCEVGGCDMMNVEGFKQFVYSKILKKVKSLDKLEKLQSKIKSEGLPFSPEMKEIYVKKKKEFKESEILERVRG